jgi:hypothetical protein
MLTPTGCGGGGGGDCEGTRGLLGKGTRGFLGKGKLAHSGSPEKTERWEGWEKGKVGVRRVGGGMGVVGELGGV